VNRRGRSGGPTLEQVAALARVSRSTVSRVVNDHPKVSPAARASVEEAIATLGYVPNAAARSLATSRGGSIALVIREPDPRVLEEPFFGGVLRSIGATLRDVDLQLLLLIEPADAWQRLERSLTSGLVEGAILLSVHAEDPLPARLAERGLPIVLSGRPPPGQADRIASVDADNILGGRQATEHLLETGRSRVAVVAGPEDMPVAIDRLAGYRTARHEAGYAADGALEGQGDFTRAGGERAARQLLAATPDLDAVVAPSDLAAVGVLGVLAAAGRAVPDDVAVTGFDDSVVAEVSSPPLTSIRQPLDHLGRAMVRLLLDEVGGRSRSGERVVLPTELIRRASTCRYPP
jgi:DNA-binding LacI/PurR family transcriptional regulator